MSIFDTFKIIFFNYLNFIWKAQLEKRKGRKESIPKVSNFGYFHPLVHSANGQNGWGYASKATSLELLPPHVDGRGLEVLGPSSPAFPGPLAGSGAARTQISTSQAAASPPESQCCLLTLITTKNFNLSCRRVLKMLQHNKKKNDQKKLYLNIESIQEVYSPSPLGTVLKNGMGFLPPLWVWSKRLS